MCAKLLLELILLVKLNRAYIQIKASKYVNAVDNFKKWRNEHNICNSCQVTLLMQQVINAVRKKKQREDA